MDKWRLPLDSTCQKGLETTLEVVLIVVQSSIAGAEKVRAEFFALRLWRCSGQPCNYQQIYGQMDVTVGFSRSERSRNNFERSSDSNWKLVYDREKPIGGISEDSIE
jgi:hypothetical protein